MADEYKGLTGNVDHGLYGSIKGVSEEPMFANSSANSSDSIFVSDGLPAPEKGNALI
jgi:hypothetical protein